MKKRYNVHLTKKQIQRLSDILIKQIYYAGMSAKKSDIKLQDILVGIEADIVSGKL
jgi:hypothetical protein